METASLDSLVPIGTVTGMLVIIMVAFLKDAARQDQRVDSTARELVRAAQAEAEHYRGRAEALEVHLQTAESRCDERINNVETNFKRTTDALYARILHLESLLFKGHQPPPPPPENNSTEEEAAYEN